MNRKSTLLAVVLMAVSSFTMNAAKVTDLGTTDNFYYLESGGVYLSLAGVKSDSVVVKSIDETSMTKAALDSALWQIVDEQVEQGVYSYLIRNKATLQYLAFASAEKPVPNLVSVVDGVAHRWIFDEKDGLKAYYSGEKYLSFSISDKDLSMLDSKSGNVFSVEAPAEKFVLKADQLGDGFTTFQLKFGAAYEGDIFSGKDLIAKDVPGKAGYVALQSKEDRAYPNGVAKYFGIDTLKTTISGAKDVFGYRFSLDSTRTVQRPNAAWQQFKFTIDLKNDSLAMFVAATPLAAETPLDADTVQVVVASVDTKQVLTVSKIDETGKVLQGAVPYVVLSKGTHANIPTGSGVYFLQSASKGANGGKYYVKKNSFMGGDSVPSVNLPRGQWYIKTENGKYSVVDRESDDAFILNQEIFEVAEMEDTYLLDGDSVKVTPVSVDLNDKYLGSRAYTEKELAEKGFTLHLIPGIPIGPAYLSTFTNDSILKGTGDISNQIMFKLVPKDTQVVAGAKQLGDEISIISYQLRTLFGTDRIAAQSDSLKLSETSEPLSFHFVFNETRQWSTMKVVGDAEGRYVGMDIQTGCLQLTKNPANVMILSADAPEYAPQEVGHKRFSTANNSLVMNPNTFLAELKIEGNPITKSGYTEDNFSLWVEKAEKSPLGKQLYYISCKAIGAKEGNETRYYLAASDTLGGRAVFISDESVKTMENSPALFAFKMVEGGTYYLENQSEFKMDDAKPYVGMVNGFAVMQPVPMAEFTIENAPAPVANEEIEAPTTIQVIGSTGEFQIRNAGGKKITLSNILGQTIGSRFVSSDNESIQTARGVVIVSVEGDKAYKVIVK